MCLSYYISMVLLSLEKEEDGWFFIKKSECPIGATYVVMVQVGSSRWLLRALKSSQFIIVDTAYGTVARETLSDLKPV